MTDSRFAIEETPGGGLFVWQHPVAGKDYIIGSDAAGGGPTSDMAAAVVVEADTCGVVAVWHERIDATPWGVLMACLGWHYQEALLGIEVYPSAHGATALHAARAVGYSRIYQRQQLDTLGKPTTKILGWRTDSTTKPQMIEQVKDALREGSPIPSELLLHELKIQRWDPSKPNQLYKKLRDDLFDAYAIALMVRDNAWTRGMVRSRPRAPVTDSERFWASRDAKFSAAERLARRRPDRGL